MKEKEVKKLIWNKLSQERQYGHSKRSTGHLNTKFLERIAAENGMDSVEQIMADKELFQHAISEGMVIPDFLIEFIDFFVDKSDKLFDPWVTRDSYIARRKNSGVGFYRLEAEANLIREFNPDLNIELKAGDPLLSPENLSDFDLVVSFPPFGMRAPEESSIGTGDHAADLLVQCCNKLGEGRKVIMLHSNRIAFDRRIRRSLRQNDIGLRALFHLPAGSHLPMSSISSYLTIAEKGYMGELFVAELSEDRRINQKIYSNFIGLKSGKRLELGAPVDFDNFNSFEALVKTEELIRRGRMTGYSPVKFEDIIVAPGVSPMRDEDSVLESHNANCIYIPKMGNSECVSHPSDIKGNLRNYLRIELKEHVAFPEYVIRFLNTPLGQLSLDSCKQGSAIKALHARSLLDTLLFIPDYNTQVKAVSMDNKVSSYINEFKELKHKLWSKPSEQSMVEEKIRILDDLNSVERWFDNIPFPLSSILWKYHATTRTKDKYEHLLHFFEALPEFLSMLLLSSYRQNKDFYEEESDAWLGNNPQYRNWYKRTDFGGWNMQFANLAKATRRLLNDKKKKELTLSLLGSPSSFFLDFITSKSVFNILDTVRQYRNDWKAHGGVASAADHQSRLTTLEEKLGELRKIVKDSFSTCLILVPGTNSYQDGVFKYNVKVLMGNRTPFNEIEVETIKPMDVNKLYMLHEGQNTPIELLPFIKYNQESKACYYYNKIESGNTRWISFHYEETSELKLPLDDKFEEVLEIFRKEE